MFFMWHITGIKKGTEREGGGGSMSEWENPTESYKTKKKKGGGRERVGGGYQRETVCQDGKILPNPIKLKKKKKSW